MRRSAPLILLVLLAGCTTLSGPAPLAPPLAAAPGPPDWGTLVDDPPRLPVGPVRIVGRSVEGRPIEAVILGNGAECVLFVASIHGDEGAGTPLLRELEAWLGRHPEVLARRRVVLVPVANPDGLARGRRYNVNGVDLNRNFAASNRENSPRYGPSPLSEPEAGALAELIREYRPTRVVSIHQPLACVDYDGPAEALARAMAAACALPVRKLGASPGSLGSYCGLELGLPIVTLELPRKAHTHDPLVLWDRYGDALLLAIEHRGRSIPPAQRNPADQ